jgi:hypothetical protein
LEVGSYPSQFLAARFVPVQVICLGTVHCSLILPPKNLG